LRMAITFSDRISTSVDQGFTFPLKSLPSDDVPAQS
jgi:hypothetical protein